MDNIGIGIEQFFKIERVITFKLAALVGDANELHKAIIDPKVDVSKFVARLSNAFLPRAVYGLEEYGLPRMISKKIHRQGYVDFLDPKCDLNYAIGSLRRIGSKQLEDIPTMTRFDRGIIRFFFQGITLDS